MDGYIEIYMYYNYINRDFILFTQQNFIQTMNQNKLKMIIVQNIHLSTFFVFSGNTYCMAINLRKNTEQE